MKKIEFESLRIRRATDIIENRISNMIIKGSLASGEKLPTEKELSVQFNVSLVTIREALRGLEVSGLIEKKRGKGGGIFVTELNNDSIKTALHNFLRRRQFTAHQLAQVRLTIEPTIVKIAASEIVPEEISTLEEIIADCQQRLDKAARNIQTRDFQVIGHRNVEFHRLIAESTHNPVFTLTMDYLMDFLTYFKKSTSPEIDLHRKVVNEHRDILTAIKERRAEEAEGLMLRHLQSVEDYQDNEIV